MGARKKYLQAECSNVGAGFALAAHPCTTGGWLFAIHEVDLLAAAQDEGVLHVLLPVPVQQSAQGTATLHMAHKTQPLHIQGLCLCRTTATGGWGSAMASDTSLLPGSIKLHAAGPSTGGSSKIDTHAHLVRNTSDGIVVLALAPLVPVAGAGSGASTSSRSASCASSSAFTCRQVALLGYL